MKKQVLAVIVGVVSVGWAGQALSQTVISADGMIESTSGGFKYPDGSVQTSAVNAGEPLQASGDCVVPDDDNSARATIYTVPAGKRLQVEHVTFGALNLSSSESLLPGIVAQGRLFLLEEIVGGTFYPGLSGGLKIRSASHSVLMHVGAGFSLECEVWTTQSSGNDRIVVVTIAGSLVDVEP